MYALKESQQEVAALLRSISNRYPKDNEIQRMVALAALALVEQGNSANELLGYRDPEMDSASSPQVVSGDNVHETP